MVDMTPFAEKGGKVRAVDVWRVEHGEESYDVREDLHTSVIFMVK